MYDVDVVLMRNKYPKVYNLGLIILSLLLVTTYIMINYNYESYYLSKGRVFNNELELVVLLEDLKYVDNSQKIMLNGKSYSYNIGHLDEKIYVDSQMKNYKYVYLKVDNLSNLDNYVYEVKLVKEKKKIITVLKDYLKGETWN